MIRTYQSYQNQQQHRWDSLSPNTNPCHNTNIVSTIQAKPKQILSKSVTLATRPTSTQQFRQGRVRELALSWGILDLKNMQRDKLTSDPKYFETCLTSLYSYITYHTDKHKPFTTATLEQIHLSCHKYQRQHLKHKQRSDNWIKISQRETAALITEERSERPRFPLPDFPSITRIILGAE